MPTQRVQRLRNLLDKHAPMSMLKQEYQRALRGKSVTIDNSNGWISHTVLAEFMLSDERVAIDKEAAYKSTKQGEQIDGSYKDLKGHI